MGARKILFVDRDGTLIEEPEDFQVDHISKVRLVAGVIPAMLALQRAGYEFVMVTNQDGLGTASFPEADFEPAHNLMLQIFESQGIRFRETLIDRSFAHENLTTRKPGIGLALHYLHHGDMDSAASAMVGDRDTDVKFAQNLGIRGFKLGEVNWAQIAHELVTRPRRAEVERVTKETRIHVSVDLDREADPVAKTGLRFFDHMLEQLGKHGGFALHLMCAGDLHIDEHHTIEDSALALGQALRQALGDKRGIGRYGFTAPMDETLATAALDLSGRPYFVFEGVFPREQVGDLPSELVPHFFRSLCETLGANLHLSVRGENTHHMIEACFKATARCLRQAIKREGDAFAFDQGYAVNRDVTHRESEKKVVVLVDSGGTNIGSVRYALERLGVQTELSADKARIRAATHVILPGVGAARPAMQQLHELDLIDTLRALKQPVLGVCLGMQLLFESSEESDTECLGLLPGRVRLFDVSNAIRVPHMGWNSLRARSDSPLLLGLGNDDYAYFVHSYAAPVGDYTLASCDYAGEFSAIVQKNNFCGMQFHPERSSRVGALLLQNFLQLN